MMTSIVGTWTLATRGTAAAAAAAAAAIAMMRVWIEMGEVGKCKLWLDGE